MASSWLSTKCYVLLEPEHWNILRTVLGWSVVSSSEEQWNSHPQLRESKRNGRIFQQPQREV